MRTPLSWIRDFTPLDVPARVIAEALDNLGLEVEAVEEPGREIRGVVVARILDIVSHPDADKLRLADVDFGAGQTRVVCGAPNIEVGMVVPFAPVGATLPGGLTLERRKIRGVVSDGMLCSARELDLSDDHAGILALDPSSELGADLRAVLGLDDVVFDLSITPNRPDAMSVIGVARDLAAHFGLPFTPSSPPPSSLDGVAGSDVTVEVEDPERCPRYLARVARVSMGPSPAWMARRLTLGGMRPISNAVDVTNYVLLELGQPLHAFDLGRLDGRGIVVRRAAEGERMITLDGVERTLSAEDLLICDARRAPQAIAGIMGGSTSEVSDSTTEILLESAYFQPMGISKSSKRLGLRSESSARFERGTDPNGVPTAADRAMQLFVEVADATPSEGALDVYPAPIGRPRVTVRTARVNALLGTNLDDAAVSASLEPLGIELDARDGGFDAIVPTFRPDLEREIDLVEEVARRVGYNEIPRSLPRSTGGRVGLTVRQRERRLVADTLVGLGCSEAFTLSLMAPADLAAFGVDGDHVVEAANPLRAEESVLRPCILPGLLRAVAHNDAHGLPDVSLFELGHVFRAPPGGQVLPDERDHLAIVLAGTVVRRPVEADRPADVYDVVDCVHALGQALGLADLRLAPAGAPGLHPARAAEVVVDGAVVGHLGEVAPEVVGAFGVTGPVVAVEVHLDALLAGTRTDRQFVDVSRFPASGIDLAFVLADSVPAAAVARTLREAGGALLEDVRCFDVFRSESLGAGRVSLAFALRFRAPDRTLTDEEVGTLRRQAIDAVASAHAATLR